MSAGRHLLGIEGLARSELEAILSRAGQHKKAASDATRRRSLTGHAVALLFFEDSTRTRSSFELAAQLLGAAVINLSSKGSSVAKGETMLDTVRNIDALGMAAIVMRHSSSGAPHLAAEHVRGAAIVNAGDGTHEHPSQALLDAFTLREKLGSLEGKRVAIIGDVLHSRVARSNLHCLRQLGASVTFCGPPTLLPAGLSPDEARVTWRIDEALADADAVMMLRVQLERQSQAMFPSPREYAHWWGMTSARAAQLRAGVPIFHPGPMSRGVEIATDVADGPSSAILEQVTNGVAVRMAILERCVGVDA